MTARGSRRRSPWCPPRCGADIHLLFGPCESREPLGCGAIVEIRGNFGVECFGIRILALRNSPLTGMETDISARCGVCRIFCDRTINFISNDASVPMIVS